MRNALKILSAAVLAASLAACGGGGDDDDDSAADTSGGSSNSGGSGGGSSSGGDASTGTLVTHTYYSRDLASARQVEIDPEADSATVTLGSDTFTYSYDEAAGTFSASDGYSLVGGVDDDQPGIQVCQNGVSAHVVLPASAQAATIEDLKGKTFTWYEDCTVSDGTGENPLPSSVTFASDGSLEVVTQGSAETDAVDAQSVAALLSDSGLTDDTGTTRLHAYKVGERPVVVFRQLTDEVIAAWVYQP